MADEHTADAEQASMPEPPRDRRIWVQANISSSDEIGARCVDPYEGVAVWSESSQDWLNGDGMSIRMDFDARIYILSWMELRERAKDAPENEITTSANIYYWDDEWYRQTGRVGFYANLDFYHHPTSIGVSSETRGPFPSRQEALSVLVGMLQTPPKSRESVP